MFKSLTTAAAVCGGLLMLGSQNPAHALTLGKVDVAKSSAVELVGRGRGGGRGGGFAMRGGGGQKFGGGKFGGSGPKLYGGGGPKFSGKFGGSGPKLYGGGGPKVYGGGYKGFKGWKGPKFSGNYKHHRRHKFRNFAFYGVPYVYGYYSGDYGGCGWLYRRAITTGSAYWWDRYYACRDGYDY